MPIYSLSAGGRQFNIVNPHVPKTGGTAIASFFRKIGGQVCFGNESAHIRGLMRCPPQHYDYRILDNLFLIEKADYSFVIVRNPFDRIKSDYKWAMTKSTMAGLNISFGDWVENVFANYEGDQYILGNHIKPQHLFLGPKIRKTYKYEEGLEKIIDSVLASLGLAVDDGVSLDRMNTSADFYAGPPVDMVASRKTIDMIVEFYKRDFELFGYSPDGC